MCDTMIENHAIYLIFVYFTRKLGFFYRDEMTRRTKDDRNRLYDDDKTMVASRSRHTACAASHRRFTPYKRSSNELEPKAQPHAQKCTTAPSRGGKVSLTTLPCCRSFGCVTQGRSRSDSQNEVTINTGAQRVEEHRTTRHTGAKANLKDRSGHALIVVLKSGVSIGTVRGNE